MRRFLFLFALLALPMLAQEASRPGGPEIEPSMLWDTINFLILAFFIGWLVVKSGGPALRARSRQIHEGLAAGEKAKAEADARAGQVQARLANLEKEVAAIRDNARQEREREAERIRNQTRTEIERIGFQSRQEVVSAGKLARLEVQRFAASLAISLAEQKIRAQMSPDAQATMLRTFLAEFPRESAEGTHA